MVASRVTTLYPGTCGVLLSFVAKGGELILAAEHKVNLFLSDRRRAEDILERIDTALRREQGRIEEAGESDAVGLTLSELALTVSISFATSVTANLATPVIQQVLKDVKAQIAELIDFEIVDFPDQPKDKPVPKYIRPEEGAEPPAERGCTDDDET